MPGSILSGWREQYDRMLRSYFLLTTVAAGREWASSDEARDALVHFFQDAYHLKDWIKNDPSLTECDVEGLAHGSQSLRLCADLCNGTKHLNLTRTRTGDLTTGFTGQSVAVRPGVASTGLGVAGPGNGPEPALHSWMVSSGGVHYDAVALAGDVVNEWEDWLTAEGLITIP